MDAQAHWQAVYDTKPPDTVSWYQPFPALSHALIEKVAPARTSRILDVGGGASTLVDALIASGYSALAVLDIAASGLARSQQRLHERLGEAASPVTWIHGDIRTVTLPAADFDVWHDRAVFHFLTDADDRARYIDQVKHALRAGGHVIIATFAADGPTRCSGLDVERYTAEELRDTFGAGFTLEESHREAHSTPGGMSQAFTYAVLHYMPATPAT